MADDAGSDGDGPGEGAVEEAVRRATFELVSAVENAQVKEKEHGDVHGGVGYGTEAEHDVSSERRSPVERHKHPYDRVPAIDQTTASAET